MSGVPENSIVITKNITIKDNRLLRNSNSKLYLQWVLLSLISGNQIQNSKGYGIYIEDSYFSNPKQITIIENSLISNRYAIEIVSTFQVIIEQNEIANNDVGLSIDYCTSSYMRNKTFLGNNKTALFRWFWFFSPIANICDKIPRFDKNFWDQNRKIPQPIIGRWYLLNPFIFPYVDILLGVTFDWNPAQGPYDILEMS